MNLSAAKWVGLTLGASFLGLVACSGRAIIDPPLGSGGAAASTSQASSSMSSSSMVSSSSSALSCSELVAAYKQRFEEAQRCDLDASPEPCTTQLPPTLECPCADFFVNQQSPALGELKALQAAYDNQNCAALVDCAPIDCQQPTAGECVPSPGGGGVCQSN